MLYTNLVVFSAIWLVGWLVRHFGLKARVAAICLTLCMLNIGGGGRKFEGLDRRYEAMHAKHVGKECLTYTKSGGIPGRACTTRR